MCTKTEQWEKITVALTVLHIKMEQNRGGNSRIRADFQSPALGRTIASISGYSFMLFLLLLLRFVPVCLISVERITCLVSFQLIFRFDSTREFESRYPGGMGAGISLSVPLALSLPSLSELQHSPRWLVVRLERTPEKPRQRLFPAPSKRTCSSL